MTDADLKQCIYNAVLKFVSNASPPTQKKFFATKISVIFRLAPSEDPETDYDQVLAIIEHDLNLAGKFLDIQDNWLFTNKDKTWQDLVDYCETDGHLTDL